MAESGTVSGENVSGDVDRVDENLIEQESIDSDVTYVESQLVASSSETLHQATQFRDEICTLHIPDVNNELKKHPYYYYPPVKDPGISKTLRDPEPEPVYDNNGQDKYVFMCQMMNHFFIKRFHRELLEDKIDLKYCGISSNWMRAMCDALMNNKTVTLLDLSDNWLTTDACFHLGELMMNNKYLTTLNLNGCRIGPEGAKRLVDGIQANKKITEINLSYNELGDEGIVILAPVMTESVIKKYNFSHNNLKIDAGRELAKALEENDTVNDLDVSWNFIENRGMIPLLKSLKSNPLKQLNISWNGLVETRMEYLVQIIKKSELTLLDVSNNLLKGEVLRRVAQFLWKPKKLQILRIGNNQLTTDDALVILKNFQRIRVACQLLDMTNTNVTPLFVEEVENLKTIKSRRNAKVIYGNVLGNYTIQGPDPREIAFKRAKFVSEKKKKDFGEFILKLHANMRKKKPKHDEFVKSAEENGIVLDNDLFTYLTTPFLNTKKRVELEAMAAYVKEIWPLTRLVLDTPIEKTVEVPEAKKGADAPTKTPNKRKKK